MFAIFQFILWTVAAGATAAYVEHIPAAQVYGEAAGVTERTPVAVRESDSVTLWAKIGYSFYYTDVAVYYTTDGSVPVGSRGVGTGTTQVLRSSTGGVTFVRNQPNSPANIDWWKAALPASARTYGATINYQIGAWYAGTNTGPEVFATQAQGGSITFSYNVLLAWPGSGSPNANYAAGYPNIHFWKEEAVVGNGYLNAQLDQNGSLYDMYFPSAGCINGMGTKNEGYFDGPDTFPSTLAAGQRGQMNINEGMAGIQIAGKTYWQSNENGSDWSGITQSYAGDTNVVSTSSNLVAKWRQYPRRPVRFRPGRHRLSDRQRRRETGSKPVRQALPAHQQSGDGADSQLLLLLQFRPERRRQVRRDVQRYRTRRNGCV